MAAALLNVANSPFPGIMGREKHPKDSQNEKIFRYKTGEDGQNPEQHHGI
jgi:hypothetical protein